MTYLLVDILQVLKPVRDVLLIADVILSDLLLASNALEDAVDEVCQSYCVVASVFFKPIFRDRIG